MSRAAKVPAASGGGLLEPCCHDGDGRVLVAVLHREGAECLAVRAQRNRHDVRDRLLFAELRVGELRRLSRLPPPGPANRALGVDGLLHRAHEGTRQSGARVEARTVRHRLEAHFVSVQQA
jgi:hypothetical protein